MEQIPVPDGWADVVISNGVINLSSTRGKLSLSCGGFCVPVEGFSSVISPMGSRYLPEH